MKYRVIVPVFAAALVLQPFINTLLPWGAAPELIMSSGLMLCLFFESEKVLPVLITGSVMELLSDMAGAQYAGFSVIAFVLAVSLVIFVRQFINIENFIVAAGIYLAAILLYYVLIWILYAMAGSPYGFVYAMSKIPAAVIGNFIFGMILYIVFLVRLNRHRRDRYFR